MASKKTTSTKESHPKTLLVGIQAPYNKMKDIQAYYDEFLSLVKTRGLGYDEKLFLKLRSIGKANFLTKGKLQDLLEFCDKNEIEEVVFSEILTSLQERNLEEILNCDVFDREKLILEIFRNSAHTAEGKIQVEMAEIEYYKTRLAGKGAALAQQPGFIGGKGPGETSKEVIKRHLTEKFRQAKKRFDVLKKSRDIQRKRRLESHIPLICLIGYTNSGKSSLINRLTHSNVGVENKLFATLDITTRELFVDHKKIGLISDTVGFISQLPHHLIEAFKSTLDELKYASLLLHVVDLSNSTWKDQIRVVQETMEELEVEQDTLFVFNKTDKIDPKELENLKCELEEYQPHVLINTMSKEGVSELVEFLRKYKFKN